VVCVITDWRVVGIYRVVVSGRVVVEGRVVGLLTVGYGVVALVVVVCGF